MSRAARMYRKTTGKNPVKMNAPNTIARSQKADRSK